MDQIQVTAVFTIAPGKQQAFRQVGDELITKVRAEEPDTLQYLWYYGEDGSTCRVREIYTNSDALLRHVANVGDLLPRLMETCEVTVEVCGPVSEAVRTTVAAFGAVVFDYHGGVDRLGKV